MIKIIKKLNIFKKGLAPYEAKGFRSGFVILFAVTLSAILLSIALGVANISQKEIKFGTSAKDTNNAFLAADIGIECALLHDKSAGSSNVFTGTGSMNCAGTSITPVQSPTGFWTFAVNGLGNPPLSCAKVTVDKRAPPLTEIIARGYNIGSGSCDPTNPNRVERQLEVTYTSARSPLRVVWVNSAGVTVAGNKLTKSASPPWGNAGANSSQVISSGDGYVEFKTSAGGVNVMAGLSRGDTDQNYTDIDYAVAFQGPPGCSGGCTQDNVMVWEGGSCKYGAAVGCTITALNPYIPGDLIRVAVESGVVKYYKNGALLYTSTTPPTYPLLVDSALYETGSTITDAVILGN